MVCVDKKSPEFLRLARRMNLDANILEQIIHKYYMESGQEELFPTDVYVNAQLGRTQYEEAMPTVRQFWENAYSQPKTFSSEGEYNRAWVQAITYFPKEAIVNYKDANGNFILAVRRPVEKLERNSKGMMIVTDAEGNRLPMLSHQEARDYALITSQLLPDSEKSSTFAADMRSVTENQDYILDSLDAAMKTGRWNDQAIKDLEKLIKKIQDGEVDFKRTVGERFSFTKGISEAHAAASLITRGAYGASQAKSGAAKEIYDRDAAQGRQQERLIEAWAKATDLWVNDYTDAQGHKANSLEDLMRSQWQYMDQASEAEVFRYDDTQVIKSISLSHSNDNVAKLLDRIALFNQLFPETALTIQGFGRDKLGHFRVIATQNLINGKELTDEQLKKFHDKYKLKKQGAWFVTPDDTALINDLTNANVMIDEQGNYYVIDADVAFNTPEMGGKVLFDNSFEFHQKERPARKERQVIGPQPFTFNDGTVVTVPFKPNEQQAEALNAMNEFLNSDETTMTLSGYAGTGKTSLMEIIAQKAKRQHKPIMFSATTNKAAAVLKARVSKAGFDAQTLNKVFGINVEVDSSKAYNARNLVTALRDADIMPGTTVVIDEASMINEENYRILNRIARENGLKIIYVGDKAQLAPVNENQVSKVFRNTEGRVVELTQVERTDDNAILKEATNIRNGLPLSGESSFNERGEGVGYLTPKSRDEIGKVIRHYIQGLKDNPNFFRILAYTNKKVTEYNDFVRTLLGYTDPIPHVGEPLTGYNNWGYDWRTKSYRFINSESYKVTRVGKPAQSKISVNGQEFTMTYVPVTMENSLGESDTFNYMDIKGNQENRQAALQLANQKKTLWEQYRKAVGREAKSNILAQINSIDQFLFVNDNIEDPTTHNLLQPKTVDFGYALTIHKSQGSTFTHVLIDDIDVAKASNAQNNAANAMAMVDLGDAGQIADATMEVRGTEEVDLGDLSSVPVESTYSPSPDVANVRQQLEYVGVSRATNTVTVISNNVKKEGSPLNPSTNEVGNSSQMEGSNLNEERATKEVPASYEGKITPDANTVFVFGSNSKGIHGAGAAATAKSQFGAIQGQGEGMQGNAYAFPTKDLDKAKGTRWYRPGPKEETEVKEWYKSHDYSEVQNHPLNTERTMTPQQIIESIKKLYDAAHQNPDKQFKVSHYPFGQLSLNGYLGEEMLAMFKQAGEIPSNIVFNKEWTDHWNEIKAINPEESRFNKEVDLITATIAPYFKTSYEDYVAMTPEKQKEMREAFAKAAHEVAKALGIPLDMKQASFNIGGYEFEDGSSVTEPSFTFRFGKDATPEQVRMFAALMGDLGYEQQEAVVTSWDVANEEERDGDRHFIEFKEEELPLLKQFGIKNFTFDKTRGVLSVLSFDTQDVENFYKLVETIKQKENGLEETQRRNPRRASFKTFYDEKEGRRALYEAWSTNAKDKSTEERRSSGSNNLVQEALEKLQNRELPIDRETPTEQPQKVSLPSYEYFMDRYEDTTVDAAWKIPLLQQLDSQLTTELTPEENNEILDRMTRILEAKSQEDLLDLQTEEPKEKKTVEQNLTEFEKMTQQINNLLDSNIISASEIRHVAELVVNSISDTITILQKEDGAAEKFFPNIETKIDFKTASRKDIVEAIGINNLIHRAKQQFDPEQNDYEDFDTIDQADLIIDNWDAIMTLAADTFAMTEGFGIMRNYDNGGFNTTQAPTIDYDNFNDYSNDSDAMAESEKDEQEHWQVEQRTIDVLNSMSQLVRLALHDCYQMDKDGNKVMSKWGIAERVNPRQAVNSILRWTQGALSLEDMIQRMQNKATQNPWLNQLVERLSDKSGQEADFQSQFFGVFSKHFQPYSVVLLEDGKYHSIPVNSHPALSEAMQTITTQFKIGEHPLFTDKGINMKLLGTERTTFPEADFNLHKALSNLQTIQDRLNHGEQFSDKVAKDATAEIMGVCRVLGYPVTEEMLSEAINEENLKYMTDKLYHMVKSLDAALEAQRREPNKQYNPFAFGTDNSIGGTLRNFLTPITDTLEDTAVSAFYDSGKMYQSYVTPSFMTKLMNKFRLEGQEFEDFIMQEYGNSEWFKSGKNQWDISRGWRNVWLQLLATDENARKVFDHKVELNFNKHNYMRNMSDAEYTLSLITEYFAETAQKGQSMVPAWFRIPIMSNKPSSEFIKFYSYRGANYKDEIIFGLHQMFNQELSRIQTVNMRNHSKGDSEFIANFDTNGRKFNFLPFLNQFLDKANHSELATLLQKKVEGLTTLTAEEEARLSTLVDQAIRQNMDTRVNKILNEWENSGILEAAQNIDGIGTEEAQIRANLENFLWNDNFASKNILQLTITDIAFYKDAEDLQKRLAQIHAPGIRGNVAATDYEGNRVSDGKYRTILIQGLQKFKTDLIANLAEVFDRKIAAAPDSQKAQWRALKEDLVGENGRYTKIDVTDGQGYSSPSSYRKKAFIFGRWSRQAEDIYQKLLKGDYNYSDLKVAFQPLKPFVYTHLQKDMGVDNAPIHSMPVPFQAKNSEYLLIMADALLQGEKTSKPNLLRAIYRVMEDSERLSPTKGIDTVQFDSAIKSGLQAPIDLNPFVDMVGGEEAAFEYMKGLIYKLDDQGNPSVEYNTDTYVHEGEYEDYCLQQEVPEHFKNHSQAHGSQIRMIIPSDLDFYKNPNGDRTAEDNQVYYEWTEPDGTKKKLKADEFRKEYEKTIADNIRESIDLLSQELHINSNDKKERNIALSKILQREILSSPRYGIDLIQACSIDKETGEFRIPKGDPIQAKRIEQLINSIIKNRVNKQKIAGGPIVQVTNFGTSRQLHIRFNDKNGGLLMTREEYEQNPQKKEMSQTDKFNARYGKKTASGNMTYEEYVKQNQAGIAYFEVFVPIWSNELFEKFANPDGSINVEAIEATDPELLKMISYRIPTEDKYSCAPMKVVGFMPREAGDAIMFPYELTEIDDSDFDVDKRYTMRKDIPIKRKAKHIIRKELFDIVSDSYQKQYNKELPANIASEIEMFLDSPDTMKDKNIFNQWMYSQYQRIAYTTEAPTSGRTYRDNKIVDMTWAVLTNEMTADKILNPGGFDVFKRNGYMVAAYKNPANNYSWEQLQQMSIDELNKLSYTEKDLTWLDTQIQFYKQNAAAASLIGVFAVNKVAHATLESNDYYVAVDEVCDPRPFIIADTEFGGRMKVDPTYDQEGNLIGKTIGAGVSASADAAKTPVLNLMNINMTTAGIFNTLLRLGMAPNDASLFMSQDVIERVLNEFNRENLTNYKPLSTIIEEHLSELREKHNISDDSNINLEALSREEMVDGLLPVNPMNQDSHEVIDYKVLLAFQKVRSLVDAMRKPTFATRFNSVSSAVGPLIIDNLIIEHKMEQFTDAATEDGTHFYDSEGTPVDIDDIFYDHPILKEFSRTVDIAKSMFYDMPAGSRGFRNLLATLPEGLIDKVYNDKKLLDNLSNFYQSYLLIASRMVNPANLKNYIDGFPKYFNEQKFKEKYPDNALIQAIRMNVAKRTGRPFLSINITGIDEAQKEVYRSAWVDLHKDNPELSKRLFEYCFFRAGIGFSPKTFMSLVPAYVKERLSTDLGNGTQATYVDTYRMFPTVNPEVVIDQWVRNNWDNNKLVPKKGGEGTHYAVDLKRGTLIARDPKDMADLKGNKYIKTRHNGQTYLWKQLIADKTAVNYVIVKPLGNNGEYMEMSLADITKPLSETKETIEDMQESELQATSPAEADAAQESSADTVTDGEKAKQTAELAELLMKQNPKFNKTQALNQIERMKEKPDMYAGFLVNVFKQKGLNLTKEEAIKEFKKMC